MIHFAQRDGDASALLHIQAAIQPVQDFGRDHRFIELPLIVLPVRGICCFEDMNDHQVIESDDGMQRWTGGKGVRIGGKRGSLLSHMTIPAG